MLRFFARIEKKKILLFGFKMKMEIKKQKKGDDYYFSGKKKNTPNNNEKDQNS